MFDEHIEPGAQLEVPWGGTPTEVEEVGIEGGRKKGAELRSSLSQDTYRGVTVMITINTALGGGGGGGQWILEVTTRPKNWWVWKADWKGKMGLLFISYQP